MSTNATQLFGPIELKIVVEPGGDLCNNDSDVF